nr:PIN domain-containing protein [Candidatus Sigynarchaeota archaeon]
MTSKAYLDTGVLTLFLARNCPLKVQELMDNIKKAKIEGHLLAPVLTEVFLHICKLDGIDSAKISMNSLLKQYPFKIGEQDTSLIISAGILKCQHRETLSYVDCMSIAYCLNNNCVFHTTEKKIKKIPGNTLQKLDVVKYKF